MAELAGVDRPDKIDGISIRPTLLGEQPLGRKQKMHEFLYWERRGQKAVRMGNYKTVKPGKDKRFELYYLDNDIGERNNIADEHRKVLAKMKIYAEKSHSKNLIGEVLDKEKIFKGHQFP